MAIHRGMLTVPSLGQHLDIMRLKLLSLYDFLEPFGWYVSSYENWDAHTHGAFGIILTHPKWGNIRYGSTNNGIYNQSIGVDSSPEGGTINNMAGIYWNTNTHATGPGMVYVENNDCFVLHQGDLGSIPAGNEYIGKFGGSGFISGKLIGKDLYFPTTRFLGVVAEGDLIGLSGYALRRSAGGASGVFYNELIPGLSTYTRVAVLPVGEYLISGKRYYQFSTNLFALIEV
ncbi:MAG TPA: hypothetical protein VFC79_06540 [Tissierellaceae bacterium]|nr:hypothetical protein [Tissierellaceae bacterium]